MADSAMKTGFEVEAAGWRRWTVIWMLVVFALFVVLTLVGAVLRLTQADVMPSVTPER